MRYFAVTGAIILGMVLPLPATAQGPSSVKVALFDGVFALDGGDNAFAFGARLLRDWGNPVATGLAFTCVPRQRSRALWFAHAEISYGITSFAAAPSYPNLRPFAVAAIGVVRDPTGNGKPLIGYNVGAGAEIFTSPRVGFRVDFREHFYHRAGSLVLHLEFSGGLVLRL